MITIKDEAVIHLQNLQDANPEQPLRVAVVGGAQGPGLGIIPDEKNGEDQVFDYQGVKLVIEPNLMGYCRQITIGFQEGKEGACGGSSGSGFLIQAQVPIS